MPSSGITIKVSSIFSHMKKNNYEWVDFSQWLKKNKDVVYFENICDEFNMDGALFSLRCLDIPNLDSKLRLLSAAFAHGKQNNVVSLSDPYSKDIGCARAILKASIQYANKQITYEELHSILWINARKSQDIPDNGAYDAFKSAICSAVLSPSGGICLASSYALNAISKSTRSSKGTKIKLIDEINWQKKCVLSFLKAGSSI